MEVLYRAVSYYEVYVGILIFQKVLILGGSLGDLGLNKGIETLKHNYYVEQVFIVFLWT